MSAWEGSAAQEQAERAAVPVGAKVPGGGSAPRARRVKMDPTLPGAQGVLDLAKRRLAEVDQILVDYEALRAEQADLRAMIAAVSGPITRTK